MQAAIGLDRLLPKEDEILHVSKQNFLLFTPLLPQIASSRINPRHIVQAIRDIRGKRRFRELITELSDFFTQYVLRNTVASGPRTCN